MALQPQARQDWRALLGRRDAHWDGARGRHHVERRLHDAVLYQQRFPLELQLFRGYPLGDLMLVRPSARESVGYFITDSE